MARRVFGGAVGRVIALGALASLIFIVTSARFAPTMAQDVMVKPSSSADPNPLIPINEPSPPADSVPPEQTASPQFVRAPEPTTQTAPPPVPVAWQGDYLQCKTNADCVVVYDACGGSPTAINNAYSQQWAASEQAANKSCGGVLNMSAAPSRFFPACHSQRCGMDSRSTK